MKADVEPMHIDDRTTVALTGVCGANAPAEGETPSDGPKPQDARRGFAMEADVEPMHIDDWTSAALAGVHRSTWQRLRAAGKVPPCVRLGRRVLWRRAEIVAWIEAGCPDSREWAAMQAAASRRAARIVG